MLAEKLNEVIRQSEWSAPWVKRGMICVQDLSRPKDKQAFELKGDTWPARVDAVGSGGWDETGALHWVGIDLDVGHGDEKQAYETRDDALDVAFRLREFVNNAAEIRLSKSGNGVHIRVAIAGITTNGRTLAPLIAKWLCRTLDVRCDQSVLGRQNLWFWSKDRSEHSFALVEACSGLWTPPPAALRVLITHTPTISGPWWHKKPDVIARAEAYMRKVDPAISGSGGHNQTFWAACALVRGFALEIAEARPILYAWNQTCKPPWTDAELEHKLKEALNKAKGERGYLLRDKPEAFKAQKQDEQPTPKLRPSDLLKQQFDDEISGKRFVAEWPWSMLHRFSLALMPGNVTVFCAPPGSSKSFFMLQAAAFWMEKGYRPAILELEENQTYHLRRALAQVCEDSSITDPEWVKANPHKVAEYQAEHADYINRLAQSVIQAPSKFNTNTALSWMRQMVAEKRRVIAIDPVTARDPSEKPWIDDQYFVRSAGEILDGADTSLVLVTHPPKNAKDTSLDNVAGGAAYQRFSQAILWMEAIDVEELNCVGMHGRRMCAVNRKLHLRKTRNGKAQNTCIGYHFNGKSLKFEECGIVPKEKE